MTNIRFSQKSWRISIGATLWLALTIIGISNGEVSENVSTAVADRGTCACPETTTETVLGEVTGIDRIGNRRRAQAEAQFCTKSSGEHFPDRLLRVTGSTSRTGDQFPKGPSVPLAAHGKAAPRGRVHALRARGWSSLLCRGRTAATFAKQLSGDPDDDQASDNPHDDDDAYEGLDLYDNTEVPFVGSMAAPVAVFIAPEIAPKVEVATPFSPFSTMKRLRC
jgi:hypothetical protein